MTMLLAWLLIFRVEILNISENLLKLTVMPGENCCVVGCGSCRRHKGIGTFKLPSKSTNQNHQSKLISEN